MGCKTNPKGARQGGSPVEKPGLDDPARGTCNTGIGQPESLMLPEDPDKNNPSNSLGVSVSNTLVFLRS